MFKNLHELLLKMPTEKDCRDYLIQQRWDGCPVCPYCGFDGKTYVIEGGKRFKCGSKECGKKYSVTVGTIFESSQIPLTKWLNAVYVVTAHKKGISSHQLGRDLGITQRTAWFMIHRIREMMKNVLDAKLDGVIEVDETYVGGKLKTMNNKKRKLHKEGKFDANSNKTPIIGYKVRDGVLELQAVPNRRDIMNKVVDTVSSDAVIITDMSGLYPPIANNFAGHEVVNHTNHEFVRGSIHTNSIEGIFSHFDRMVIGTYHYLSAKHMQAYCHEFSYRFNTRKMKDADRFTLSLQNMERRLTWNRLTKKD